MPLQRLGSLDYLDFNSDKSVTVLMMHGYGANAYDLSGFADEFSDLKDYRWIFPQGPLSVQIAPGYMGNAWFPIDIQAHQEAAATGVPLSYANKKLKGMNEARDQVLSLIKNLNLNSENLVLAGFSQGSMLAFEVAKSLKTSPKGLMILSGTLVDKESALSKGTHLKDMPYFISHGENDPILPFSGAEALDETLEQMGLQGERQFFRGGHEIPHMVTKSMHRWLQKLIKS